MCSKSLILLEKSPLYYSARSRYNGSMMNSKSKANQDAELLKDFVEAIERRAKELVDGETKGFTLG